MQVKCQFIAANATPKPHSLLFLNQQTIAFAFGNQIALYSIPQNKIFQVLPPFCPSRINCLQSTPTCFLVAGSDAGMFCCYDCVTHLPHTTYNHNSSILSISLARIQHTEWAVFNDANGTIQALILPQLIKSWSLTLPLNRIINTLVLLNFNNEGLLFLGGVDQTVHCYSFQQGTDPVYNFGLVGHEDAITYLAITPTEDGFLLASSSKDGAIRLWRAAPTVTQFHRNVKQLHNKKVYLDAVLNGHQSSVTAVDWMHCRGKLRLTSCSLDCTVGVWEGSSVCARMGQMVGNKNAYFHIKASEKYIAAVNYTGAVLLWECMQDKQETQYVLKPCFNGHSAPVTGLQWDSSGSFLVSTSKDQSSRIYVKGSTQYHQLSRPQIHGYDINTITTICQKQSTIDLIVCGADEKVMRVLQPPSCFANYLNTQHKTRLHLHFADPNQQCQYLQNTQQLLYKTTTQGGTQVLGLMTKQVPRQRITTYYQQQVEEEEYPTTHTTQQEINYNIPPHQDYLTKHTLWPQANKLYGHPHQITLIVRSPDCTLLASCCNALNKISARVLIWDTRTWKIVQVLSYHSYTVHAMEFSDRYFASAGKDRRLVVYDREYNVHMEYEAHARTITCISIHNDILVTGSKDKTIKVHCLKNKTIVQTYGVGVGITALAFCRQSHMNNILVCGCTDGRVIVLRVSLQRVQAVCEAESKHTSAVNAIKWNENSFATCSDDCSVRIYSISI